VLIRAAAALALGSLWAAPARACGVALLLALDVSASVDGAEYRRQMDGLAAALTDARVVAAVEAQPGGVALAAYEWSGRARQSVIVPWRIVAGTPGLARAASAIAGHPRGSSEFPTAIGFALGYGHTMLRRAPACTRRVLDVSGDGVGNDGFPPASAYRAFDFSGVTVNGLAIRGAEAEVVRFYREEVIRGPGAFVIVADGFDDYARAMREKLLRELRAPSFVSAE